MLDTIKAPTEELFNKLDKQANRIQLLEEELRVTNHALEEKNKIASALELDLEHAIYLLNSKKS